MCANVNEIRRRTKKAEDMCTHSLCTELRWSLYIKVQTLLSLNSHHSIEHSGYTPYITLGMLSNGQCYD